MMHVGREERQVVVPAVPDDHVRLGLRLREDLRVVDARVDDVAGADRRLVLLALLDRDAGGVEVGVVREALAALRLQIAVRHRVAHRDRAFARLAEHASTRRVVCDLPAPVRAAHTATTGTSEGSIVSREPSSGSRRRPPARSSA